jgi:hypothetical protein
VGEGDPSARFTHAVVRFRPPRPLNRTIPGVKAEVTGGGTGPG